MKNVSKTVDTTFTPTPEPKNCVQCIGFNNCNQSNEKKAKMNFHN